MRFMQLHEVVDFLDITLDKTSIISPLTIFHESPLPSLPLRFIYNVMIHDTLADDLISAKILIYAGRC